MTRFPRPDYRALDLYTPDRRPVAVDLSDNTNRWGAHPDALAAVRTADDHALTRYPDVYARDLRGAIERRYGVPEDAITTGCGSDNVLDSAFRAAGPAGGSVRFAGPTFSMVEPLARMNGRAASEVTWARALEEPAALLEGDPAVVYVCRPNNPTGESPPRPWVHALLAEAGRDGPLVVLDEAYADFAGDSLIGEAPISSRLVVVRTLSKAYGLAGLRVGFAVAPPQVAREMEKSRGPYMVNSLAERAAVAALEDVCGWTARTTAECVANRERLVDALVERGLAPLPSTANFVLIPVPEGSALAWNRGLRDRGVAVRPFPGCFDSADGVRVSVAPWSLLERFLAALDEMIEEGGAPVEPGAAERASRGVR